jgi:hypothetical protein
VTTIQCAHDSVTDALTRRRITRGKCHSGPLTNAATRERVQWARGNTGVATRGVATAAGVFLKVATEGRRIKRAGLQRLSYPVVCPRKDSNPWGSVLRVICVTNALLTIEQDFVRPRGWRRLQCTCDCSMVTSSSTQITLAKKGGG